MNRKREGFSMAKTEKELCALMERVNDYWIGQNLETGDCAWERAAYFWGTWRRMRS